MTMDFICLVLQAAGGAITSTSGGTSEQAADIRDMGVNIMIAGLTLQVISLVLFITYASVYAWRWNVAVSLGPRQQTCRKEGLKWKALVISRSNRSKVPYCFSIYILTFSGLGIASITVLVRSAFRVAELRDGFDSDLANDEVSFMILEGAMLVLACLALTISHPGLCLSIPWQIKKLHRSSSESMPYAQEVAKR